MTGITYPYEFKEKELKDLVLLLRKNEEILTEDLDNLKIYLQDVIYSSMTIEEAENFFNETIS